MQILSLLRSRFLAALEGWVDDPESFAGNVSAARDANHGDYQANIAMPLAKKLGMKPRDVAAQLIERLDVADLCAPPEVAGPGFINLRLNNDYLSSQLTAAAIDPRLGVGEAAARSYVIDYSSPNVAKPMHVGHIRSTVIGDALARILRFLGHNVVADNHLGDWGTQFGMIIYGYKHFADADAFGRQPVAELSRLYRLIQQIIAYQAAVGRLAESKLAIAKAEDAVAAAATLPAEDKKRKKQIKSSERGLRAAQDEVVSLQSKIDAVESSPELTEIASQHTDLQRRTQQETVKLHEGDEENLALWKKFVPISIQEIDAVYERLGIQFDHTLGESFYHPMLEATVSRLQDAGLAKESDGAICIFVDGFDAPMIIRKRDGAYLYATTDMATIEYRKSEFAADEVLYVVDHRQGEHFDKLFAAARQCGYDDMKLNHVAFGTVLGPDGRPFKTRSGEVIGLEYLLDQAVSRAHEVVCDPERLAKGGLENMSDEEKLATANVVGLGAIKYADLSHNRTSDYEFNIEKMVQLEGNTSAYIQYMYARVQSIVRKSEVDLSPRAVASKVVTLEHAAERSLVLQLLQFEDALIQSTDGYFPSTLATYLYGVAKRFASFFDQCHVLNADSGDNRESRLVICFATARVLKQGLELLGIGVVNRM